MPWQRGLLDRWLAVDSGGLWAAPTVGASIPRQQGKSEGLNLARVAYGLVVLRENIAFTSHRADAEREFFEALKRFLCQPCFQRFVTEDDFRAAVGREALTMKAGNKIEFMARSNKSGRAKHADLIILDEAQFLTASQKASILPTTLTRHNMQTIETGTPPEFDDDGHEFRTLRKRGEGAERFVCWDEWGVERIPEDVSDRDLWYEVMPSLGHVIDERNVEILLGDMEPQDFARELLGVWTSGRRSEPPAINPDEWRTCTCPVPPAPSDDERIAAGVKFSADGSTYSLSVAAKGRDGPVLVECLEREGTSRGIGHLVDWIVGRRGELAMVAVDGREWTATLVQRLADLGFPKRAVHVMRTSEAIDACAMLSAAVSGRTVEHIEQPLLEKSVETSSRRPIGREGWGFKGPDPTPVESVALAHWAVTTSKRNPKRRMKVSV